MLPVLMTINLRLWMLLLVFVVCIDMYVCMYLLLA